MLFVIIFGSADQLFQPRSNHGTTTMTTTTTATTRTQRRAEVALCKKQLKMLRKTIYCSGKQDRNSNSDNDDNRAHKGRIRWLLGRSNFLMLRKTINNNKHQGANC
jgi:hypothetical protein